MKRQRFGFAVALLLVVTIANQAVAAWHCPFCTAVSQTFTEEIDSMDAVIIATLVTKPKTKKQKPTLQPKIKTRGPKGKDVKREIPKVTFKITQVIKGKALLKGSKTIKTIYFGTSKPGKKFLIMGVDPPNLQWSTPLPLTDRSNKYLNDIIKLPKKGADRLRFFQNHLEDKEELIARDAYDEFAKSPYADVKAIKKDMDRPQLVLWIKDRNVPASRRRLYLTMLGICGGKQDVPMLESLLKSKNVRDRAGLDALIACYLTLKGADGLKLIDDLYLKNKKADYADTYAAIMALRFHGTESNLIPRKRLLKSMHHMLNRPQLADLVIPDLARWEDWSVMDKLVKLYKNADDKSSWVRVPVINYMRACPLPKAKANMKLLKKIDPAAVKRANTFFPFGAPNRGKTKKVSS